MVRSTRELLSFEGEDWFPHAYFSCFAPDEFVRFCFFRFLGGLSGTLLGHLFAQLGQLLLFLLFCEGFDLERCHKWK
jgi:hypothetical protein